MEKWNKKLKKYYFAYVNTFQISFIPADLYD